MDDRVLFAGGKQSRTWGPTDRIAWVSAGGHAPPVLSRMWRCTETLEVEWKPLETIVVRPSPPSDKGE